MRRLGEYELLRKIGAGGMAEVWMGRRAALAGASKAVAIKLLARDMLDDPDYRAMFIEEARLSMLLTNSNVVQVFDVGEIDGECFMVMEWVDGLNLAELTHKMGRDGERVPVEVAAHITGEVLRALAYAHGLHHDGAQATIVHRDVSPHNVLLSISGEVKLADFGVARLAREETSGLHVKGKLRYMAPEQLRGRSREPTVDLYAVGAILHELLQGERFRTTRDEGDLYSLVLSGAYPPLTVQVPAELDQLRVRLLEPEPSKRLQSADEGLELLYAWPGYRNSSLEIGKLIRKWVGVKAPRSGILSGAHVAAAAAASSAAASAPVAAAPAVGSGPTSASAAVTRQVADAAGSQPHVLGASAMSDAVTMVEHAQSGPELGRAPESRAAMETRTAIEPASPEHAPTTMIPTETGPVQVKQPPSMMVIGALVLAVSFGIFGLGFPLGLWGGGEPSPSAEEPGGTTGAVAAVAPEGPKSADDTPKVETPKVETPPKEVVDPPPPLPPPPSDSATTTDSADSTQASASTTPATDTIADETTGAESEGGESGDEGPKVEEPARVAKGEVTIAAGDLGWAFVRIDSGKSQTAQPLITVKLSEGSHTVKYRQDESKPWVTAGKIKVVGGKAQKFKFAGGKIVSL